MMLCFLLTSLSSLAIPSHNIIVNIFIPLCCSCCFPGRKGSFDDDDERMILESPSYCLVIHYEMGKGKENKGSGVEAKLG